MLFHRFDLRYEWVSQVKTTPGPDGIKGVSTRFPAPYFLHYFPMVPGDKFNLERVNHWGLNCIFAFLNV
jgi:hypothetical protein